MLAENLVMLRDAKGMTQEQVAEVIGISRQSYAKWEQGETVPDIDKCARLAAFYGVKIDALVNYEEKIGETRLTPPPEGKFLWGTVKVGNRGSDRHTKGGPGQIRAERRCKAGGAGR